jgi:hypothetical protein
MRTLEWLARRWWLVLVIGLALAWTIWPQYRRYAAVAGVDGAPAQATLLKVQYRRRSNNEYWYEYRVDGKRFLGIYTCACEELSSLRPGGTFSVHYANARPEINLPAFTLSRAAQAGYWLFGAAVLVALGLLAGGIRLARWLADP